MQQWVPYSKPARGALMHAYLSTSWNTVSQRLAVLVLGFLIVGYETGDANFYVLFLFICQFEEISQGIAFISSQPRVVDASLIPVDTVP